MKEFHITIGSSPDEGIILNNDLNLTKTALLYADKVELISCKTNLWEFIHSAFTLEENERFNYFKDFFEIFYKNNSEMKQNFQTFKDVNAKYNELRLKKHKTPQELIVVRKFKVLLNSEWNDFLKGIKEKEIETGYEQLIKAKNLGILDIYKFSDIKDTKKSVNEFVNTLGNSMENRYTFPLLDFITADLMNETIKDGIVKVDPKKINRGKHCSIAAELFERLPLFENASISEILDIRKELSKYLIRFRSAMLEFSDDIVSEIWDADFTHDVDNLMIKKIEPTILEIEENVKANSALQVFLKELATKPLIPATSTAIGLFISNMTDIPLWLPPVFGTGSLAYNGFMDYYKEKRKVETNKMFLYYKAKRLLQ